MPYARVLGVGPLRPRICIVGESPGSDEVRQGIPFVGRSGKFLNSILHAVGLKREDIYLTNILKEQPPGNDFKKLYKEETHKPAILEELKKVDANIYVFVGGNVMKTLLGLDKIYKRRGSIYMFQNSKALVTFHPSWILRTAQFDLKAVMVRDFQKVIKHSGTKNYPLQPKVEVIKSASALESFLFYNSSQEHLAIDIECTTGTACVPICVGMSFTEYEGVSVPLFSKLPWIDSDEWKKNNRIEVRSSFNTGISEQDLPRVWQLLAALFQDRERKVFGHNFKYDESRLESLGFFFNNFFLDTALAGYTLQPEFDRNLGFWSSVFTDMPYFKDEGESYNPGRKGFEDYLRYNARDAVATRTVGARLMEQLQKAGLWQLYREFQHKLHYLYKGIEETGFHIDKQKRYELMVSYCQFEMREQHRLNLLSTWLAGSPQQLNVNSPKKLSEFIYDVLAIRPVSTAKATNEDEIAKILLKQPGLSRPIQEFLRCILRIRKVRRIVNLLKAEPDFDGKMKTSVFIIGTDTGRTSTHQLNQPNRPIQMGWPFQTLPKHNKIGKDLRNMLLPSPGCVLVQIDSAQAEARVIALLSTDMDFLKMMDTIDVHAWTAAKCFGGKIEQYNKSTMERFTGKTGRHAFNLGIKKLGFYNMLVSDANKFGIELKDMSVARANEILMSIHLSTPKVRNVFQKTVAQIVSETKILWSPHGFRHVFHNRVDSKLLRVAYSFIPQNTVTTNTKRAALQAKKEFPWLRIILECHDSLLFEVEPSRMAKVSRRIKELMEEPIDFSKCSLPRGKLVIPADVESGPNYGEMEEVEL